MGSGILFKGDQFPHEVVLHTLLFATIGNRGICIFLITKFYRKQPFGKKVSILSKNISTH